MDVIKSENGHGHDQVREMDMIKSERRMDMIESARWTWTGSS